MFNLIKLFTVWYYTIITLVGVWPDGFSPLEKLDHPCCLPSKSYFRGETNRRVTLQQGWIIGILYRIFMHQTASNRIPAALRKYSIKYIKFLLCLQRRTCRWTPCLLSVESREVTIIGNTWGSRGNFLGISLRAVDLTMKPYD